LFIHF
jgi:SpoVK/Ycf46/Vps4 family AAA+-type ATPase